jgi:CRISPR-associated protein Cmr4
MYKIAKPLFLHCQTPLHAGSGDDLGVVDLPIQRESHTGFPKIEASSLKGALRESFEEKAGNDETAHIKIQLAFGHDDDKTMAGKLVVNKDLFLGDKRDYAGALGFSDARLLLFPLKSMRGIFVWATCSRVLSRLKNELTELCGQTIDFPTDFDLKENELVAPKSDPLSIGNKKVQLEEYCFDVKDTLVGDAVKVAIALKTLTGINDLDNQLVIVHDNVFSDFAKIATEVITRIKINNATGIVQNGALFTEEYLSAESVLYSLVLASPLFAQVKQDLFGVNRGDATEVMAYFNSGITAQKVVQIGGNATLGKGIVKTKF